VGGGDQLYNDDVLKSPALQPFLQTQDSGRPDWDWSDEMQTDVRLGGAAGMGGRAGVGSGGGVVWMLWAWLAVRKEQPLIWAWLAVRKAQPLIKGIQTDLTARPIQSPIPSTVQVESYYFHHYAVHFSFGAVGEAMRSIPYVMTWDDVG